MGFTSVGIVFIIVFSAVISIERSKIKKDNKSWIIYTILAAIGLGAHSLVVTYIQKQGVAPTIITFYVMSIILIINIIIIFKNKIKIKLNKYNLISMLGIGFSSALFNILFVLGFKYAPNPGYINAASAGSVAILTLLYYVFFKDELNIRKIIGVFGVIIGLVVLFI